MHAKRLLVCCTCVIHHYHFGLGFCRILCQALVQNYFGFWLRVSLWWWWPITMTLMNWEIISTHATQSYLTKKQNKEMLILQYFFFCLSLFVLISWFIAHRLDDKRYNEEHDNKLANNRMAPFWMDIITLGLLTKWVSVCVYIYFVLFYFVKMIHAWVHRPKIMSSIENRRIKK